MKKKCIKTNEEKCVKTNEEKMKMCLFTLISRGICVYFHCD